MIRKYSLWRNYMSKKVFEKIPKDSRSKLKCSDSLTGVNEEPLKEFGRAIFKVQLGHEEIQEEFVVAEIEDDALLGIDILLKKENAPVALNLHESLITFKG